MTKSQYRRGVLLIVGGLTLLFSACARWIPVTAPTPADSSIRPGTVRITKTDNQKVVLTDAVIMRDSVTGSSHTKPPAHVAIPADQIRVIERQRGAASRALLLSRDYLAVVSIIGATAGLIIIYVYR
jgi:hypothetical protein